MRMGVVLRRHRCILKLEVGMIKAIGSCFVFTEMRDVRRREMRRPDRQKQGKEVQQGKGKGWQGGSVC